MRETVIRLLALARYYIPTKYLVLSPKKPQVDLAFDFSACIIDPETDESHFYDLESEFDEDYYELAACFKDSCEVAPRGRIYPSVIPGNWVNAIIFITVNLALLSTAVGFFEELGKDIYTESKEVFRRILKRLRNKSNQILGAIPEGTLPLTIVIFFYVPGVKRLIRGIVISDKEDVLASALSSIRQIYLKYLKTGHACEYVYDPINGSWESADVLREAMNKRWYRQPKEAQETVMHRQWLYSYYANRLGRELS